VLISVTTILFEVYNVDKSAPVTSLKLNGSGVVSGVGGGPEDSGAAFLYGWLLGRK